jgi:hypothetical protein
MVAVAPVAEKEVKMARGRRAKVVKPKPPTRLERMQKVRARMINLKDELVADGFGALLKPPGSVKVLAQPLMDPKTNGMIGHVQEPLAMYIQRVSVVDNFSQRPPFEHAVDPIYRRLIRDFISEAVMPESKVAVLSKTAEGNRAKTLEEPDIRYSVVDGLQRLCCYCLALLLVWRRDQLVKDGCITQDAWDYFSESVTKAGDPRATTEKLLKRLVRYEVFYHINLGGLLHYMVTFNTGQRRMSLPIQLEIMQRPLIDELENRGKVAVAHDIGRLPGEQRPKDQFAASDLVLATRAFISNNPQVSPANEAEQLLELDKFANEDQAYLENVGDIDDVVKTLKRVTTQLHPKIMQVYADDINRRYILSAGGIFLIGLAAACGYVRNRNNMKMLDGALDKLQLQLDKADDDPLNLAQYHDALAKITSSRGKTIRRLVYDTFLRFFMGATPELEWLDTARQITGFTA